MNFKRIYFTLIFILGLAVSHGFVYGQVTASGVRKLIVFYSPACHRCIEIENEFLPKIEKEFKGKIQIEYRDITNIDNYTLLLRLREKYNRKIEMDLPVFFFEGKFLNGEKEIKDNLRALIAGSLKGYERKENLPAIDLVARFKNLTVIAVISAG
jgi:hypothetical protein